ncbi:hypothetical protein MHZ95_03995 [Sporosarcina sp. ACRSM]|uniref:hypothetical protein n=1 Tax=Sporosarcina sp. ACRSM TaxID=2918216 RepID=UPI001EF51CC8|nr:hypothetical protein [Sporosarcina sp. ACRSM]MCG7334442.1 hypothetical protein [Sporosarcina sp. ACRSM]
MTNPISVFIMDVSHSSKGNIGSELSEYLQQLEARIAKWTENIVATQITHRAGDELVVVSNGYATAYTLAFYLSRIWEYADHKPYFGLSFGDIQEDVNTLNVETWIHPLMKQAREANDFLKKQQNRAQFHFQLADFPNEKSPEGFNAYGIQFETLLNVILTLQQEQMNEQTEIQSLVCSLFLILAQQNKVSHCLGRSASTVSSHMKKGKTDAILHAFQNVVNVLDSLETDHKLNPSSASKLLQRNIRQIVSNQLDDYFPSIEGGK